MTYYKVVDKDLRSITTFGNVDGSTVQYHKHIWVRAPRTFRKYSYHLLVFKSLDAARLAVLENAWDGEIYECSIKGKIQSMPDMLALLYIRDIIENSVTGLLTGESWPKDTVMARRVRLNRFVQNTR